MESLLLGTLSYYGNTINNTKYENTNYNSYNGNIEEKINNIEETQAQTLKNNPEYFKQFDSLSFDNLSNPTSENMAHISRSGFNTFLQRDLDFNNGYSEFQNTDMHYNVIPKEEFVHNNMIPFTSRRETFINLDSNTRKYEQLSGNNSTWKNKKEVEPFFNPVKDMNNVFGMPVMTEQLSQRYNPSLKNNYGNLPFQTDIKVTPGLDGKNSAPYAVHRVMPRNIDDLRSEINKKVSYESKPLETIKKGDIRAIESQITNFKLPSYREVSFDDLIPNKFYVEGEKKTGKFVHIDTERGMTDYDYIGGAYDSNKGFAPNIDNTNFTPAKRENYLNDFTHALNAVNTRPIFTNIESYTNYETDRSEISQELHATGAYNINLSSYYNDNYNIAKPTMKQNNIIQDRNLGIIGAMEQKSYVFSNDAILPKTIREIINYNEVRNTAPTYQSVPLMLNDKAKHTIKETTINNYEVLNVAPTQQNTHITLADIAKRTIRETTEKNNNISNISSGYQNINVMLSDNIRPTIKQTTVENNIVLNIKPNYEKGNVMLYDDAKQTIKETTINNHGVLNIAPIQQNTHITLEDIAKKTIRETTENNNYQSNISSYYKKNNIMLYDEAKPTIKQSTIINSHLGNASNTINDCKVYLIDEAKPTIKQSTIKNSHLGNASNNVNDCKVYLIDEAKPTIKQSTIKNSHLGNASNNVNDCAVYLIDEAKPTIKQSTIKNTYLGNATNNVNDCAVYLNDEAKPTIKQSTIINSYNGNTNYQQGSIYVPNNDEAKQTVRQTTEINNYIGIVGGNNKDSYNSLQDEIKTTIKQTTLDTTLKGQNIVANITQSYIKNDDEAKTTIKETLLHEDPGGRMYNPNEGYYNINDDARVTIKQSTLLSNYKGSAKTNVNALRIEEAERNMCIDDKKQKTVLGGRLAGAKSDKIRGDINKDTIRFNDKRYTFGYVSTPGTSKNYSITPINKKQTSKKTDLNTNTFYHIDPLQISTLNNNPLVNDIYHQKNIDFNTGNLDLS